MTSETGIRTVSSQFITRVNDSKLGQYLLNPPNTTQGITAGKVARFFLRFIIGTVLAPLGGVAGFIYHLGGMAGSLARGKWESLSEHGRCFVIDLAQLHPLVAVARGLTYATHPQNYTNLTSSHEENTDFTPDATL